MSKKLVIFGTDLLAQLASHYFSHDSDYDVVGFTIDGSFINVDYVSGEPVIPFEEIESRFDPAGHSLFVALSYRNLNALRTEKLAQARAKGYPIASYLSSRASVWPGFELAPNCFILENVVLQPFTTVGENSFVWCGCMIAHHSSIEENCFVSLGVVTGGCCRIGRNSFVGLNATIRDRVSIGERSLIGAGCLVLENTEPGTLMIGDGGRLCDADSAVVSDI